MQFRGPDDLVHLEHLEHASWGGGLMRATKCEEAAKAAKYSQASLLPTLDVPTCFLCVAAKGSRR